MVSGEELINL